MKFSLCIPMYNESSIVRDTVRMLVAYMKEHFDDFEILFVNDGSKDKTWELIEKYTEENILIKGIKLSRNKGHQNARRTLEDLY